MGVRIALDDFGTGYSSLSYLTEFPFDKVKVDRSFVRDLQGRPEKIAVVEAIARMARALSMNVTVEGVETHQQLEVLRDRHCDIAQGFLYSPARPAREIEALIARIEALSPHARARTIRRAIRRRCAVSGERGRDICNRSSGACAGLRILTTGSHATARPAAEPGRVTGRDMPAHSRPSPRISRGATAVG